MTSTPRTANCQTYVTAAIISTAALLVQLQQPSALQADPDQKDTTDGLEYSFDRLVFEVTKPLADRPVLAIWLFDESGSVNERRAQVIERLRQLYATTKRPNPLYSAAVGFSKDTSFLTPQPVDNFPSLKQAVDQLVQDKSGVEAVFKAVLESLDRWKSFPDDATRVDVSIIIVTDEVGDDWDHLEDTVNACTDRDVRVFCLGNAAPFGQEKGRSRFIYPDGFQEFIPVTQGPETAIPDTLRLPIWPPANSDPLKQVSSGCGPWALSRLCSATGGRFFIAEDTGSPTFPRAVLTDYIPSYEPLAVQKKAVHGSTLRRTIAECTLRVRHELKATPRFTFRADSAPTARAELTSAQKKVAILSYLTTTSVHTLKTCTEERESITDKRLQAAFDLAYGRAMLQTARAAELNYALAKMRIAPTEFANETHNTWQLLADPTAKPLRQNTDLVTQGSAYLRRVAAQHPNTPFAYVAQAELDRGTGWKWEESQHVYRAPPPKVIRPILIHPKEGQRRIIKREQPRL